MKKQSLASLREKVADGKLSIKRQDTVYKGQSWGGSGVMVISPDSETLQQYPDEFNDQRFITPYAYEIGHFYNKIKNTSDLEGGWYNHVSKHEFWSELTRLGIEATRENNNISCPQLLLAVIDAAIATKKKISHNYSELINGLEKSDEDVE